MLPISAFVSLNESLQYILHFRRIAPLSPLRRQANGKAVAFTEQSAALSGISRANRTAIVLIQRFRPCLSPVDSATEGSPVRAEVWHNLQLG